MEKLTEEKRLELLKEAAKSATPIRSWWAGDERVSEFMPKVDEALNRSGKNLTRDERTDIYNRSYEAIYYAIIKYDKKKVAGEL